MRCVLLFLALAIVATATVMQQQVTVPGKYDYRRSFKKPYFLPTTDGEDKIPHFNVLGDVILSTDYIRLAASVRSQRGAVWSQLPTDYINWSVEIKFLISGRGRIGGDGIAFWYTREANQLGPVFGSKDQWDGLAVILDTYDNDNQHNNPAVLGVLNDGTIQYNHNADGEGQAVASCGRHFRNPAGPTSIKIDYLDNKLVVSLDTAESGKAYVQCFQIEQLKLPAGYYFGISAATGGLADDHDVFSFEVTRLYGSEENGAPTVDEPKVSEEQQKKFDNVQHKVQEMRDKQDKENDGSDPSRGFSNEMEAVLAKLDAIVALQMDFTKDLEVSRRSGVPGAPIVPSNNNNVIQMNQLLEEQQRLSTRFNEIENLWRKLAESGTASSNSQGNSAAMENRINSLETMLQAQGRSQQQILTDLRIITQQLQNGPIKGNNIAGNNAQSATLTTESFTSLNIILMVIIAILLLGIIGFFVSRSFSSKNDFKKFN